MRGLTARWAGPLMWGMGEGWDDVGAGVDWLDGVVGGTMIFSFVIYPFIFVKCQVIRCLDLRDLKQLKLKLKKISRFFSACKHSIFINIFWQLSKSDTFQTVDLCDSRVTELSSIFSSCNHTLRTGLQILIWNSVSSLWIFNHSLLKRVSAGQIC